MTILLFFGVLFVLVVVHEWGHFIAAKKTGMRVDEFGVGLPPRLWGKTYGETEYTVNALPIGGFVKIHGENLETVDMDEDKARAFGARPKWAQAIVLAAGVLMNVAFAWLLFFIVLLVGVPTAVDEEMAGDDAYLVVTEVLSESPAALSGLTPGSTITSFNNGDQSFESPTPTIIRDSVRAGQGAPVSFSVVTPDGDEKNLTATPTQALIQEAPDMYAIGLGSGLVEVRSVPFFTAVKESAVMTWEYLVLITVGIMQFFGQIFSGTADFAQVAGPVGIAGMVGDAAAIGLTTLLVFTAIISLNLAVVNLLPIPALDGGRLLFVAIEAATGKTVPPAWYARINTAGFIFLWVLIILVTVSDVAKL
jgi:regulator of sigma E protease